MIRQAIGKQSEKNRKHRSHSWRRFFLGLVCVAVLVVGLGLLARIESLQVSAGSFENIVVTDTQDITLHVTQYLDERFLYPKSNRIWFSERRLERFVAQSFPRLDMVDVSLVSGNTIKIWASERQGAFLWCGDFLQEVRVDAPCYFADASGFVFDSAPFFAGTTFVRLYGVVDGENPVGQQGISPEIFSSFEKLDAVVRSFGFSIQAIQEYSDGQYEFVLNSQKSIEHAPRIRFVLLGDVDGITNLEFALKEQSALLEIREKYDTLEYLDVRFADQVIYKFKDSVPVFSDEQEKTEEQILDDEVLEQTISEEETLENSTEG